MPQSFVRDMSTETVDIKNNKSLTPKLRFKEFKEMWDNKSLGDVTTNAMYGLNAAAVDYDGFNKYIRITDIDEESRSYVPDPLTSPDGDLDESFKVQEGDILFARTGASVGKCYLYKATDGNLFFAGFLIRFNVKSANPYFIYSQTFKSSYNKWVKVMSMRSGQPGINAEEYKSFTFYIPSLPEQQKIASFLSAVDEKIQQLTRKKELLEQYKKGVMQQLFSGKLRFKDENGKAYPKWEDKRLGNIVTIVKGKGISKTDIVENGALECIRYGELYTHYKERITKIYSRTNVDKSELVLSDYNDVIIPSSGETQIDIARAACVLKSGVALGGDLNILVSQQNGVFLSYYINHSLKFEIAKVAQGNSVVHLYPSQLEILKVMVPSLEEQKKIAEFIGSIDDKVESINTQIEKTQNFKKGLLQQMFV